MIIYYIYVIKDFDNCDLSWNFRINIKVYLKNKLKPMCTTLYTKCVQPCLILRSIIFPGHGVFLQVLFLDFLHPTKLENNVYNPFSLSGSDFFFFLDTCYYWNGQRVLNVIIKGLLYVYNTHKFTNWEISKSKGQLNLGSLNAQTHTPNPINSF